MSHKQHTTQFDLAEHVVRLCFFLVALLASQRQSNDIDNQMHFCFNHWDIFLVMCARVSLGGKEGNGDQFAD